MSEKNRKLLFVAVFALAFYVFGAACVESFVNYYTWGLIGADEFQAYHNALSPRIVTVMVAPWLVEICLTFVLMRNRPSVIPVSALAAAQALNFVALVSTIFIQLPIQMQFGENGLSLEALDRLIATDPIRWVSAILKMILYLSMMSWVVNSEELWSGSAIQNKFRKPSEFSKDSPAA
jgi:hypothetical protein